MKTSTCIFLLWIAALVAYSLADAGSAFERRCEMLFYVLMVGFWLSIQLDELRDKFDKLEKEQARDRVYAARQRDALRAQIDARSEVNAKPMSPEAFRAFVAGEPMVARPLDTTPHIKAKYFHRDDDEAPD